MLQSHIARTSFDKTAISKADALEQNPSKRRLRRILWDMYYKYYSAGDLLLELNCGTGVDTLELASNGIHVLATDSSAEMISEVSRRLSGTALHSFVTPVQLSFQRLRTLSGKQFDGAFSGFGGLNCTGRLYQVAFDLAALVRPGGYLVLCIMPDFSIWETMLFTLRGNWKKALRRRQPNGVLANVNGEKVWVHFYSPQAVRGIFARHFEFIELRGLNVLSPPPTARVTHKILWKTNRLLEALEDSLPANSKLHGWGDHYIIVFRRKY
jgi:2-polyprenyl-3-methyl-5-hydroxy-6-metoxy-1,4-benzoquinol methylase